MGETDGRAGRMMGESGCDVDGIEFGAWRGSDGWVMCVLGWDVWGNWGRGSVRKWCDREGLDMVAGWHRGMGAMRAGEKKQGGTRWHTYVRTYLATYVRTYART